MFASVQRCIEWTMTSARDSLSQCAQRLTETLRSPSVEFGARSMASILLRQLLDPAVSDVWEKFPTELRNTVKRELLGAYKDSAAAIPIRRRIVYTIAQLAARENKWEDVFAAVVPETTADDVKVRDSAMFAMEKLCEYAPKVRGVLSQNCNQ